MAPRYSFLALVLFLCTSLHAEHLPGGTITTRCVGSNFHEITLKLFRDCNGNAMIPQTLSFSNDCGVNFQQTNMMPVSVEEISPLCEADLPNSRCNGGSLIGFELYTYRTTVFLSPCTLWRISWSICCRNPSINVQLTPGLYLETTLSNLNSQCNEAPDFVDNTVPLVCVGQPVSYDASAFESDGNTLRYRFIDARFAAPAPTMVQYQPAYSGAEPFNGMVIDSLTGRITFLPTIVGVVVTVVEVMEYDSSGNWLSTVMRDFPFIVTVCNNDVPNVNGGLLSDATGTAAITGDRAMQVCSEGEFCAFMDFDDSDQGQVLSITSNIGDVIPGANVEVTGTNPVVVQVCGNSTGLSEGSYQFSITAMDDACPVQGFQQFAYTLVVGVAPYAGDDATVEYCATDPTITLFDQLGGTPPEGGSWSDPNGQNFGPTFEPASDTPGDYTYILSDAATCPGTATLTMALLPASDPLCMNVGLNDRSSGMNVIAVDALVPGRIHLREGITGNYELVLMGTDGRVFRAQHLALTERTIRTLDLSGYAAGAYVIRLTRTDGSGVIAQRIVL